VNINHYKFWPARIPHELVYPRVPLFEFLDTSARRYPESDAIIYYGTRISYLSLLNAVEKLAGELHGMGVRKGDRVALYLQNSPHFIISFFGVMRANAIVVPVNPMLTERELKFVLEDSGSIVLITTSDFYSRAAGLKDKTLREIIVGDYGWHCRKGGDFRRCHPLAGFTEQGKSACPGRGGRPRGFGHAALYLGLNRHTQGLYAHPRNHHIEYRKFGGVAL